MFGDFYPIDFETILWILIKFATEIDFEKGHRLSSVVKNERNALVLLIKQLFFCYCYNNGKNGKDTFTLYISVHLKNSERIYFIEYMRLSPPSKTTGGKIFFRRYCRFDPSEPLKSLLNCSYENLKHRSYNSIFQITSFVATEIKHGKCISIF